MQPILHRDATTLTKRAVALSAGPGIRDEVDEEPNLTFYEKAEARTSEPAVGGVGFPVESADRQAIWLGASTQVDVGVEDHQRVLLQLRALHHRSDNGVLFFGHTVVEAARSHRWWSEGRVDGLFGQRVAGIARVT